MTMRLGQAMVTCMIVAVLAGGAAGAAPAPDLLGYGRMGMTVDRAAGTVTFSCENAEQAEAVLSKLIADFTWDPQAGVKPVTVRVGKTQATGYALAGAGAMLVAQKGEKVYLVAGKDAAEVGARAAGLHLDAAGVRFAAGKRHPAGLDYWDLSALRAYYSWRLADYRGYKWTPEQVAANDQFARDFGLQTSFQFPFWGLGAEGGDGAYDTYSGEYEIKRALRNGHDVEALYGPAEMPWWLEQKFPEDVSQHDPYVLYGDWGGVGEAGAAHLSYWAGEAAFAYAARFTQEVYKRYRAVGGDRLAAAAANLLPNPGFEVWVPAGRQKGWPAIPDGVPQDWRVGQTAYEQGRDEDFPVQGTVARDTAIKHGGEAALRIENGLTTDITDVICRQFPVEPNTIYRFRVWVRGEEIVANPNDGCGVLVWCHTRPIEDLWKNVTTLNKPPDPRTGTFDWLRFAWRIETPPDAHFMDIVLRLRRASGKVWYDDAELEAVGKITVVETY
jgi:hypothetical protein